MVGCILFFEFIGQTLQFAGKGIGRGKERGVEFPQRGCIPLFGKKRGLLVAVEIIFEINTFAVGGFDVAVEVGNHCVNKAEI